MYAPWNLKYSNVCEQKKITNERWVFETNHVLKTNCIWHPLKKEYYWFSWRVSSHYFESHRDQSVAVKVFCVVIRRPFLFLFVIKCFRKCYNWNTKWEVLCVVKSCFRWVLALKSCPKCNFGQYWKAENETVCWCPCSL